LGLLLASCAGPEGPSLPAGEAPVGLRAAAEHAEARAGVPADLVLALAWVETQWQGVPVDAHEDEAHLPQVLGVGGIRPWLESDPVAIAQRELGVGREEIARDPALGVLATAAVLRALADRRHGESAPPADDPGAWAEVLGDYAGLDEDTLRAKYAEDVLRVLELGIQARAAGDEEVTIRARPVHVPEGVAAAGGYHHPEYDGALWVAARAGHYTPGRAGHGITHIIIHTMQGSYAGSISWFRSPSNPYLTSTQYLIRSSDGEITQMVHEADSAHHIGGWNPWTIGIEHEGYVEDPGRWYTEAMYRSSARLVQHLCTKYGIPIDREHIRGHSEVPGATHTDPGGGWDWDRYMGMVHEAGGPPRPPFEATFVGIAEAPTELGPGEEGVVRIDFRNDGARTWTMDTTRLATSDDAPSGFYADYNWLGVARATPPDTTVAPGETGRFSFVILGPVVDADQDVSDTFRLLEEGTGFFGPDVEIRVHVRAPPGAMPEPMPEPEPEPMPEPEPEPEPEPGPEPGPGPGPEPTPMPSARPDASMLSGGCSAAGTSTGPLGWIALAVLVIAFGSCRSRLRSRSPSSR
jgi:hypothetical protein